MISMVSGEKLRYLRVLHNKSAKEVAKMVGVSAPYISGVESGREKPSQERYEAILKAIYAKPKEVPVDKTGESDEVKAEDKMTEDVKVEETETENEATE